MQIEEVDVQVDYVAEYGVLAAESPRELADCRFTRLQASTRGRTTFSRLGLVWC